MKEFLPGEKLLYSACFSIMAFVFVPLLGIQGLFVSPVADTFQVPRTAVTGQIALAAIICIFASIIAGKIFKKIEIRKVMILCSVITALTYLGKAGASNLIYLYIFTTIGSVSTIMMGNIPIALLVNNWRGGRNKGTIMAFIISGSGIGTMLLNPVISCTNDIFGWRFSYALIAAVILLLILPIIIVAVHDKPKQTVNFATGDDSEAEDIYGVTFSQAKKRGKFWLAAAMLILIAVAGTSYSTNIASYYTDLGFGTEKMAAILFFSSLAALGGKFLIGNLLDWKGLLLGIFFSCSVMIIGLIMIFAVPFNIIFYIPGSIIMSIGAGVTSIATPIIILSLFGNADYSTFLGWFTAASSFGVAVGGVLGTLMYDYIGSYSPLWISSGVILLFAIFISLNLFTKKQNLPLKINPNKTDTGKLTKK